jgi:hypothetical protein
MDLLFMCLGSEDVLERQWGGLCPWSPVVDRLNEDALIRLGSIFGVE